MKHQPSSPRTNTYPILNPTHSDESGTSHTSPTAPFFPRAILPLTVRVGGPDSALDGALAASLALDLGVVFFFLDGAFVFGVARRGGGAAGFSSSSSSSSSFPSCSSCSSDEGEEGDSMSMSWTAWGFLRLGLPFGFGGAGAGADFASPFPFPLDDLVRDALKTKKVSA